MENFNVTAELSISDCHIIRAALKINMQTMLEVLSNDDYELLSDVPKIIRYFDKLIGDTND